MKKSILKKGFVLMLSAALFMGSIQVPAVASEITESVEIVETFDETEEVFETEATEEVTETEKELETEKFVQEVTPVYNSIASIAENTKLSLAAGKSITITSDDTADTISAKLFDALVEDTTAWESDYYWQAKVSYWGNADRLKAGTFNNAYEVRVMKDVLQKIPFVGTIPVPKEIVGTTVTIVSPKETPVIVLNNPVTLEFDENGDIDVEATLAKVVNTEASSPLEDGADYAYTRKILFSSIPVTSLQAGEMEMTVSRSEDGTYTAGSVTEKITFVDERPVVDMQIEPLSLVYDYDSTVLEQAVLDALVLPEDADLAKVTLEYKAKNTLSMEQWVPFAGNKTLGYNAIGVGTHPIRLTYAGDQNYAKSSIESELTITKAPLSISVANKTIRVGSPIPSDLVTVNSEDPSIGYYTVYVGVTSDVDGGIYIELPADSILNNKVVKELLSKALGQSFDDMVKEGISINEFVKMIKTVLSNKELLDTLKLLGVNTESFEQLLTVLNRLPENIPDLANIYFTAPYHAGFYTVTAITDHANYKTAVGVGSLTIRMNKDCTLVWDEEFPTQMTVEQIKKYENGAHVIGDDGQVISAAHVQVLYCGTTATKEAYMSEKLPTVPGAYVAKAVTLGGDYFAEPIAAPFIVTKSLIYVYVDDAEVTYGNEPEFSVRYTWANGESADFTGTPAFDTEYKVGSPIGEYEVKAKDLVSDSYVFEYMPGKLTVVPKEVSIKWGQTFLVHNGQPLAPSVELVGALPTDDCGITVSGEQVDADINYQAEVSITNNNYKLPEKTTAYYAIMNPNAYEASLVESLDSEDVAYWLEVKDITGTIEAEKAEAMTAFVDALETTGTIGAYLDVNLFKQVGVEEIEYVTELSSPATITFNMPESLINTSATIERSYMLVREHEGEMDIVSLNIDDSMTVSFDTDRFSTYAIVCVDTEKEIIIDETEDETESEDVPVIDDETEDKDDDVVIDDDNKDSNQSKDKNEVTEKDNTTVKTGDPTQFVFIFGVAIVGLFSLLAAIVLRRRTR